MQHQQQQQQHRHSVGYQPVHPHMQHHGALPNQHDPAAIEDAYVEEAKRASLQVCLCD